jgi:hypothetical protein
VPDLGPDVIDLDREFRRALCSRTPTAAERDDHEKRLIAAHEKWGGETRESRNRLMINAGLHLDHPEAACQPPEPPRSEYAKGSLEWQEQASGKPR